MDGKVNGDRMPKINAELVSQLVGRVLTIYDAAYAPSASETLMAYNYSSSAVTNVGMSTSAPTKEQAIKTLITGTIWDWYKSIE